MPNEGANIQDTRNVANRSRFQLISGRVELHSRDPPEELGKCITTGHFAREDEVEDLLGIPYDEIARRKSAEVLDVGTTEEQHREGIGSLDFLDAVLAIHIRAIVGFLLNEGLEQLGLKLPLFVTCLFSGILITNFIPQKFPRFSGRRWPSRTPSMALIADIALGTFLAMSLMSMQLWTLIDLAGPIVSILAAQFVIAVVITVFVVFRVMGSNYDAAVVCSGFGGISLGATPTAMANMSAVTQRYGASHMAFIIVPLVAAFFIDLVNALFIPFFLANF